MGSLILKYQVQYEQSGLLRAHEAFFLPRTAATWPELLQVLTNEAEEAQVQMLNTSTSVSHSGL